ncbi:pol protein [Cucumis melo var. makuwa]|uniref:Pol protein n=1 Tax=Cucumis melo var. makuwa TaxID=1194695 RepID=A0A5D3D9R9_CUCMM|nr:pol protein [Cucumis melo var. makuwa]TYK20311.1 pol protein [Cucumis melo var. makuwa]
MKREVADFVSRCLVCQQMKAPRQRPACEGSKTEASRLTKLTYFILGKSIYTVKMLVSHRSSGKDFDMKRASACIGHEATIGMAPFEALYGRCCKALVCWGEVSEQRTLGPELVQATNATIQKFRARILTAQSRQKSYVDEGHKDLEFDVGDMGRFEILEQIGPVAYRLALPPAFSAIHDVFHVSMLRKYVADSTHVVDFEPLKLMRTCATRSNLLRFWQERSRCSVIEELHWSKSFGKNIGLGRPLGREKPT